MKKLFLAAFLSLFQLIVNGQITVSKAVLEDIKRPVAFRLSNFSEISLPVNEVTGLNVTVKEFDLSNNSSGSSFVAPDNGVYHFDTRLNITYPLTDYTNYARFYLRLHKNGAVMEETVLMNPQTAITPFHTLMICTTHFLNKGDVISVFYYADANPGTGAATGSNVSFSGYKINQ